jgi:MoaA/NifB/PqqE/SkfB family radical SAM enzyme
LNGIRVPPITIDCALTQACNFKCRYCYGQLQKNPGKPLQLDRIYRFLDDAAEIGVKAVSLVSDGESTCSPHWVKAILRGKANGLDMALGTNGLKLSYNQLLDVLPKLTYLRFNISAAAPDAYAQVHGVPRGIFQKVLQNIIHACELKEKLKLSVTIGLQMVLLPELKNEILPLAKLGADLGVDYLVIKHCSDDEFGSLGIDYDRYPDLFELLKQAESLSTSTYQVAVKWSKIKAGRKRIYSNCYGPPFIMQFSGSGLVAPCGMLFNERYKRFHIGNLNTDSLKDLFRSDRYWKVMDELASERFDARTMCGSLCLQHKVNEALWALKHGETLPEGGADIPHKNFA